jgi:hypothetical protein
MTTSRHPSIACTGAYPEQVVAQPVGVRPADVRPADVRPADVDGRRAYAPHVARRRDVRRRRRVAVRSWRGIGVLAVMAATLLAAPTVAAAAQFDRSQVQRKVTKAVRQAYPDLTIAKVTCKASNRAGSRFSCRSAVGTTLLHVDGRRSRRTFIIEAREAVITKTALEAFVAEQASLPATIDCGPTPVHVVAPATVLPCAASMADGTRRQVEVTVADRAGTVTITKVA